MDLQFREDSTRPCILHFTVNSEPGQWGTDVQLHDYFVTAEFQTDDPSEVATSVEDCYWKPPIFREELLVSGRVVLFLKKIKNILQH